MKKLLLILSLFLAVNLTAQSQVNHLFWAHNNDEFAGYGMLYNWNAASDANFCPAGWHVPTSSEYQALDTYIGSQGGKLKEVGFLHWQSPNTGATDEYGFKALGGGRRNMSDGSFQGLKQTFYVWTSTQFSSDNANYVRLEYQYDILFSGNLSKKYGFSVRLIKDDSTDPGSVTDYDGNVYKTVKIGDQVWTASNWKCTKLNDGTTIPNVTDNAAWAALTTMGCCDIFNQIKYR